MKKTKKSTKVLLILIPTFIILGIIFSTIGLLKGIGIWYVFDGFSVKSSNMYKVIEESKEVEPFTSIKFTCPFKQIEIKKGEKFFVEYTSHQYLVEPEVTVEDGVLNILNKAESKKVNYNGGTIIGEETYHDENSIVITIPENIIMENIEFSISSQLEMLSRSYISDVTTITDIAIKKLSVERAEEYYNRSWLKIEKCTLDNMNLTNTRNAVVNNSQIGELTVENASPVFDEYSHEFNNSTINRFVTKHALSYGNEGINIQTRGNITLQKSKVFSADIATGHFKAYNGEIANSKIASGEIQIDNTILSGQNDFTSKGDALINSAQQSNDLSCEIARAVNSEDVKTEIVGFDDPRYAYGYISMDTMGMGTREITLSDEEYEDVTNNGDVQPTNSSYDDMNKDWEYQTTMIFTENNKTLAEGNKFNDYLSMENTGQEQVITVYEKKAITYTVNEDGYISYIDLRGRASSDKLFLSIGIDKSHSNWQMSKPSQSQNRLKCFSENGSVSVSFAN